MKYSPHHNSFVISQEELQRFSQSIRYVMADIRKAMKVPLSVRKREGSLQPIDHIEKEILDGCLSIGVDFGVKWGRELDLTDTAN